MCIYMYLYIYTPPHTCALFSLARRQYFWCRLKQLFQLMWANESAVDNINNM